MLVGSKLFKHPYARNNHANERQEATYGEGIASINKVEMQNSAFGGLMDRY